MGPADGRVLFTATTERYLAFPFIRDFIKSELCNVIFESYPDADILAGVATAGIAWGVMAADH
jgi:hypothetical protein